MQRAGKAECPLCRSKVVLLADKSESYLNIQIHLLTSRLARFGCPEVSVTEWRLDRD